MNQCGLLKGCGFELVWAIESIWVGCFGGAGMCMVAEASLNWCGLVISVLEFPVVDRWVSGLFGWLFVCFGFSGWLVVLDSRFCGFGGCVSFTCNRAPLRSHSFSQTSP